MTCFGAIVLAAGLSRRMGGPNKLLLPHRGLPLAAWAFKAALGSRAERFVLVTGRDGNDVAAACAFDARCARVQNDQPDLGLSHSLRLGIAALDPAIEAAAVLLADMPEIDAELLDLLFASWRADAFAVAPEYGGELGNPALLSRAAMRACDALSGDVGARRLFAGQNVVRVAVATPAIFRDIDTTTDLNG